VPEAGQPASLRADCARCFGLCCVVPAFAASADFALDKPAGQPCPHLRPDFRCGIHDRLRQRGFPGCAGYDCFGAGQQVSQVTFGGRDWRRAPGLARQMFAVFPVVRQLHELLWYLVEALNLVVLAVEGGDSLRDDLHMALDDTEQLTRSAPGALLELDLATHRRKLNVLLMRASELVRHEEQQAKLDYRGADLVGKDLSAADLRGANFRGALLMGANLSEANLTRADLTGADLRGADLSGAILDKALFVRQSQLESARGNQATQFPALLTRPLHW
jgi:uncharacterized protein YjbI with pentapeptide repeats